MGINTKKTYQTSYAFKTNYFASNYLIVNHNINKLNTVQDDLGGNFTNKIKFNNTKTSSDSVESEQSLFLG